MKRFSNKWLSKRLLVPIGALILTVAIGAYAFRSDRHGWFPSDDGGHGVESVGEPFPPTKTGAVPTEPHAAVAVLVPDSEPIMAPASGVWVVAR